MRKSIVRRLVFACVLALGPLATACELAFDFDRGPLQPQYDGSAPADASEGGRDGRADGGRDA